MSRQTRAPDWNELREQFRFLRQTASNFNVATRAEVLRHELHLLTYGQISSNFSVRMQDAALLFFVNDEAQSMAEIVAYEFGKAEPATPPVNTYRAVPLVNSLEGHLERRRMSHEFIRDWGHFNYVHGIHSALVQGRSADQVDLARRFNSKQNTSTLIQRLWYAHWMMHNGRARQRQRADEEFEQLIRDLKAEKRRPASPYPRHWYTRILVESEKRARQRGRGATLGVSHKGVASTYLGMTRPKMQRLIDEYPLVTAEVLPPLKFSGFPAARGRKPSG